MFVNQIPISQRVLRTAEIRVMPEVEGARKVDVGLPGEGNSNCHGARPGHLITMIKWIRTKVVDKELCRK